MKRMDCIQLKLCDIQGRLFKLSTDYASETFIRSFMYSEVAEHPEILYWIGYLYRYWACSRGEKSRGIYRQAPAKTMLRNYMALHSVDPEIAIEDLLEIGRQRKKNK